MANKWIIFAFAILVEFTSCTSYKIAIFVPDVSGSQILLNVRVAEILAAHGHKVTLIRLNSLAAEKVDPKISPSIEQWRLKVYPDNQNYSEISKRHSSAAFKEFSFMSSDTWKGLQEFLNTFIIACEIIAQDKPFLEKLRNAKFDIAFTHIYDYCPIGLIHYAKIPTWIWLNGAQLTDVVSHLMGVPSPPSYVPPLFADSSDQMSFMERVKSFIGRSMIPTLATRMLIDPETEILRKHVDPKMPHLNELGAKCPLVMVNSDEMYTLARPTLHKIIYIGGLGMSERSTKPLETEFKEIVDRSKHIIVVSFGSVANATFMPDSWKDALINAFKQLPEIQFIMRYSGHDLDQKLPSNVHISKWIPQVDLLQNAKTRAFMTHGGFNSLQEAIHSAKPIIAIPLFGDQFVNGQLAERYHIGLVIKKSEFTQKSILNAINKILNDEEYTKNIKQLLAMIRAKPVEAEKQLVKWTEFLAEFKTLPNMAPYGAKLGFIQYFCVDVIAFLASILFSFLFVITCMGRVIWRKMFTKYQSVKPEKKIN